jgi:hypothetical protein
MSDEVTDDPPPPPGSIWRKAIELKPGDKIADEAGMPAATVDHIEQANWIKTSEGPCVWIHYRNPRGDQVASKSDEFAILVP